MIPKHVSSALPPEPITFTSEADGVPSSSRETPRFLFEASLSLRLPAFPAGSLLLKVSELLFSCTLNKSNGSRHALPCGTPQGHDLP